MQSYLEEQGSEIASAYKTYKVTKATMQKIGERVLGRLRIDFSSQQAQSHLMTVKSPLKLSRHGRLWHSHSSSSSR